MNTYNVRMSATVNAAAMMLIAAVIGSAPAAESRGKVDESMKRDRYLLLDSRIIENTVNAQLSLGKTEKSKHNPLFGEDKPWEQRFDNLYANVIYDEGNGLYKCWYSPFIVDSSAKGMTLEQREKGYDPPPGREMAICYATSQDGITWRKPELGIIEYEGSKANNIVWREPHGSGVFKDLRDPDPQRRYKAFLKSDIISVGFSADGIHWGKAIACPEADAAGDTHNNAFWAPTLGKYVGITRSWGRHGRQVARTSSDDFRKWTAAKVVLEGVDNKRQTYAMPVFFHGGVYLGLIAVYDREADRVSCELSWSPDTVEWHRICPGTPLIANSEEELAYDWGCVYAGASPVFLDDEIRIYYGGSDGRHFGWRNGFFCLATLRPDGFAGYEPLGEGAGKPATIITKPVVVTGSSLRLSADVAAAGYVKVTLLDKDNEELAQGKPLTKTVTDAEVQWPETFSLEGLNGKELKLRFELRDSKLYSFNFHSGEPGAFQLQFNEAGVTSLKHTKDSYDTDYIMAGKTLGEVVVRYRSGEEDWREANTNAMADRRKTEQEADKALQEITYRIGPDARTDLELAERFAMREDALLWTIDVRNQTKGPLEIGDLALPLLFNTAYVGDAAVNYTQRLIKHSFISGHGSFIFWQRANGEGPYLVMTPLPGTKLEYFDIGERGGSWEGAYSAYIHSASRGKSETRGTWRQAHTSRVLSASGTPGSEVAYGFKFRWAKDYDGVRDVLYEEGQFDVNVVPGMTVPSDLFALVSLRTRNKVDSITAEYPEQTVLEEVKGRDTAVYRIKFSRLGENLLTVKYGEQQMVLEFFVTEPLETLIKKRAAFLADKQQHRAPGKWYDGLISVWDMRTGVLRGPENADGFDEPWWAYVLATDDSGLCKAPYLAAKNVYYPEQREIEVLEYYLEKSVWGGLQRTDKETPHPYGIYGVPNWNFNRNSGDKNKGQGDEHIWRVYDYPHIVSLYLDMYRIAKHYPKMTKYLDKEGYLERAYGTAMAYFKVQYDIGFPVGWSHWAYKLGLMNDGSITQLIEVLAEEGRTEQFEKLRAEWEKKVKYFLYDSPFPYGSEMPFDSTAFESTHAAAKYALKHPLKPDEKLWFDKNKNRWYSHPEVKPEDAETFLHKQIEGNVACRGWLETSYYHLGSDYRQCGSSAYTLSYMSQLGGWALLDYALYYDEDPADMLRLGYASYLSSWALMNTGTPESNYGYWFPGKKNDGASGWAFKPEKFGAIWLQGRLMPRGAWYYDGEIDLGYIGALRSAGTIVTEDPLFGLIAYGGLLAQTPAGFEVIPKDGLRRRLHILLGNHRLHILLDRDGFAEEKPVFFNTESTQISFTLENRTGDKHTTRIALSGLAAGSYKVAIAGQESVSIDRAEESGDVIEVPVIFEDDREMVVEVDKRIE
ncbi:DUF5695 domain-containing protein [Candidatus Sumerlaeota bacterium]